MKKLFLIPFLALLAGCASQPHSNTTVEVSQCPIVGRAYGSTGSTQYTCERLACDNEAYTFACEFKNVSDQTQPGVSLRIGLFTTGNGYEVAHSHTIFANSLQPGQSDSRALRWKKAEVAPVCGPTLERCFFLPDRVWPK